MYIVLMSELRRSGDVTLSVLTKIIEVISSLLFFESLHRLCDASVVFIEYLIFIFFTTLNVAN